MIRQNRQSFMTRPVLSLQSGRQHSTLQLLGGSARSLYSQACSVGSCELSSPWGCLLEGSPAGQPFVSQGAKNGKRPIGFGLKNEKTFHTEGIPLSLVTTGPSPPAEL